MKEDWTGSILQLKSHLVFLRQGKETCNTRWQIVLSLIGFKPNSLLS